MALGIATAATARPAVTSKRSQSGEKPEKPLRIGRRPNIIASLRLVRRAQRRRLCQAGILSLVEVEIRTLQPGAGSRRAIRHVLGVGSAAERSCKAGGEENAAATAIPAQHLLDIAHEQGFTGPAVIEVAKDALDCLERLDEAGEASPGQKRTEGVDHVAELLGANARLMLFGWIEPFDVPAALEERLQSRPKFASQIAPDRHLEQLGLLRRRRGSCQRAEQVEAELQGCRRLQIVDRRFTSVLGPGFKDRSQIRN